MSSEWKPEDSHLDEKGEKGVRAVEAALKRHGLNLEGILTSRDVGIDMVRYELRKPQPPGWQSWQLPAFLRSDVTFFFLQVAQPGSILPEHEHEVAQFRIVLSGELLFKGIELKGGDWIYTPKGAKYSLSVATNPAKPCVILYAY
jgi:hypothetical protein